MKLHEILNETASPLAPWMLKKREDIEAWLKNQYTNPQLYDIRPDLTVDLIGVAIDFNKDMLIRISQFDYRMPIQFNVVSGSFYVDNCDIQTLRGVPRKIYDDFYVTGNPALRSLEFAPELIGNYFKFTDNPRLKSLHNIHKIIRRIGGHVGMAHTIESNILGLLKINGLKHINTSYTKSHSSPGEEINTANIFKAIDIVNKYLHTKDIHSCQEELLEAGLKEYARL